MLRSVVSRIFFIKNVVLWAMFFFLPLCAMELAKPAKKKKQLDKKQKLDKNQLFNCGLTSVYMPHDIAKNITCPHLSLQDIGRLKQISKAARKYWSAEHICPNPQSCVSKCSTYACVRLAKDHYACTKALAHCAQNEDIVLFQHWWHHHEGMRNANVHLLASSDIWRFVGYYDKNNLDFSKKMSLYRSYYGTQENINKNILDQVRNAMYLVGIYVTGPVPGAVEMVKALVQDRYLSLFQQNPRMYVDAVCVYARASKNKMETILQYLGGSLCYSNNVAMEYLIYYTPVDTLRSFIESGHMSVNAVDSRKRTPLHYACKQGNLLAVMLLLEKGADCDARDKFGKKPDDYVMPLFSPGYIGHRLNIEVEMAQHRAKQK